MSPDTSLPIALSIAGSDPSGGAGLQGDLKTFHQHGVFGQAVVTLLTVQDTQEVHAVHPVDPAVVAAQIDVLLADRPPAAAKTGTLGDAGIVEAVADRLAGSRFPLVVDPILRATSGAALLDDGAVETLKRLLLPRATLLTPNAEEAAALSGTTVVDVSGMERAARALANLGAGAVLVTGLRAGDEMVDLLWDGADVRAFRQGWLDVPTHGTGCTLSAAITAHLARGDDLPAAVEAGRAYVRRAIEGRPGIGRALGFHAEPAFPTTHRVIREETP